MTRSEPRGTLLTALDGRWRQWFNGLTITSEGSQDGEPITTIAAAVIDQSALRGILSKVWDLNLILLSVARADPLERHSGERRSSEALYIRAPDAGQGDKSNG